MKLKLTLLLLLIILVVSGSSCEASVTTANYKDLEMARMEGKEAVYTNTFTNDTPEIYVTGVLDNAPGTTNLKSEWYYMEDEEALIDSAEAETEELKTEFNFSLSRPDDGWPEGAYEIRLFIDGEHQETLEFEVEEAEGSKATYKDLKLAKEEGDEPVYTNTFTTVTPKIYAVGMLENASGTTNLKSEWYYMEEGEEFIDSAEVQTEESSTEFYFNLNKPEENWQEGTYEVRLFINGEHQETLEYEVEEAEETEEAEGSKAAYNDVEMAKLEGEEPIYTDTFSTDTPEIYVVGMLENASGTTNLKSEWYYIEEGEEFIDSAEVQTEESNTEFYFNLNKPDDDWPVGSYEVRLFINGEHQETLEFEIESFKANFRDLGMVRLEDGEAIYTDTFSTDIPEIYVNGILENASGTTKLKSEWYYIEDGEAFIDSAEGETTESKTEFHFSLSIPDDGWPAGTYEVRLFINGEHQETLEFNIE